MIASADILGIDLDTHAAEPDYETGLVVQRKNRLAELNDRTQNNTKKGYIGAE